MPTSQTANNLNNNNNNINNNNNENNNLYTQIGAKSKSTNEINLAEVRSSLDRRCTDDSPEIMFTNSNENLLDIFNGNYNNSNSPEQLYKNVTPTISANGALVPPPYRDPPPPRNSPLQYQAKSTNSNSSDTCRTSPVCQNCNGSMMNDIAAHSSGVCSNPFLNADYADFDLDLQSGGGIADESESIFQATQYNDLLALIKFQREKISIQQSELSKVSIYFPIKLKSFCI